MEEFGPTYQSVNTLPEQRQAEFHTLENSAMSYLSEPHILPKAESLNRWRYVLRLWHYPSFTAHHSWAIYQRRELGNRLVRTLVRQVTWDRASDCQRLSEPLLGLENDFHSQPTIEVRDRPIATASFEDRLKALATISFPAFATSGIGIDGETFGVSSSEHGANVEWWCDGPESWREITAWAAQTRKWLINTTSAPPNLSLWDAPRPKLP
jgi:hypothetical protein